MEELYLPAHLIHTFFQDKPIQFRFGEEQDFEPGTLFVTVYANRKCNFSITTAAASNLATYNNAVIQLHSDMLDKVFWDATNQLFRATFDKRSRYLQD